MIKLLKGTISRVEVEEAALRVPVAAAGVTFFLLSGAEPGAQRGVLACTVYLIWAACLWALAARLNHPSVARRTVALVADQLNISLVLAASGPMAAPVMLGYLWVIFGASVRYGNRYGWGTAVLAILGLACVTASRPEWREQHMLVGSWLVALAIAPAYIGLLAGRVAQHAERYRKQSEELAIAATHDRMTGLANRDHFQSEVDTALEHLRMTGHGAIAVLFVDLDGFKTCNDVYGHAAGDEVLRMIANDMRNTIRSSDLAARFGGDEFAILLTGLRSVHDAARIVSAIIRRTQAVRTVTGHQVRISASAGISYVRARDADAVDTPTVIARADRAMLRAKRGGKSTFRLASGPQSVVREFDLAGEERKVEDNAVEALTAPDR